MEMNNTQPPSQVKFFIQGQYAVVDLLGQGASGAVYLVKDERNHQNHFVLKEVMHAIRKERRGSPFDARVLRRLKHLALPRIYQVFPGDKHDRFYLLMDYIEGSNLVVVQRSVPGQRFSLPEAMTLMSPILDAVSYLHRQHPPLIHADIKPSNIIVPKAGAPSVLVDFGGGKDLEADTLAQQRTLPYRAPEQAGQGMSPRTDMYALGATFYTLLTGTVPAAASDRVARLAKREPDPLVPVNQIAPYVRLTVARAIHGALSIQSDDRFATVEQFREVLWQFMTTAQPSWLQVPEPMITSALEETKTEPDVPPVVTQVLELAEGAPAEDQMGQDAEPDATMPEGEILIVMVDALIEAEVASAPASSGPHLSSALAGEDHPAGKGSLHERSPGLRPKKPGFLATGRARRRARDLRRHRQSAKRGSFSCLRFSLSSCT